MTGGPSGQESHACRMLWGRLHATDASGCVRLKRLADDMGSLTPAAYRMSRVASAGAVIVLFAWGCYRISNFLPAFLPIFDSTEEFINRSPEQYAGTGASDLLPLDHVSVISTRISGTRDGYDAWWRFTVSKPGFLAIAKRAAGDNRGPETLQFEATAAAPSGWKAQASVPSWWRVAPDSRTQSIHWCLSPGSTQRRHGWFIAFNPDSNTAWFWHWNHQYATQECD